MRSLGVVGLCIPILLEEVARLLLLFIGLTPISLLYMHEHFFSAIGCVYVGTAPIVSACR